MSKTFGGTIAELRKEAGISQVKLAQLAKVSRNYIVKIENETATNPSMIIVIRLAKALQVPSEQLLKAFEQPTEKETQNG